jgi:hypothetical protein
VSAVVVKFILTFVELVAAAGEPAVLLVETFGRLLFNSLFLSKMRAAAPVGLLRA